MNSLRELALRMPVDRIGTKYLPRSGVQLELRSSPQLTLIRRCSRELVLCLVFEVGLLLEWLTWWSHCHGVTNARQGTARCATWDASPFAVQVYYINAATSLPCPVIPRDLQVGFPKMVLLCQLKTHPNSSKHRNESGSISSSETVLEWFSLKEIIYIIIINNYTYSHQMIWYLYIHICIHIHHESQLAEFDVANEVRNLGGVRGEGVVGKLAVNWEYPATRWRKRVILHPFCTIRQVWHGQGRSLFGGWVEVCGGLYGTSTTLNTIPIMLGVL